MRLSSKRSYFFGFFAAVLTLLPLFLLVLWSVSKKWQYPGLWPQEIGLKIFKQMINEPSFLPASLNSLLIASITTLISLLIAVPAARYFAFQTILSQRLIEVLIYLPLILPAIAVITSSQVLFLQLHLTGTFSGIILIHTYLCLPYAMQVLLASYRQLGEGYSLTAESLGANSWSIFWQITWPLLRPGMTTAASLVFIVSFSQYLPTFFIGGGRILTLPLVLLPYANNGRFGLASAYSLVFLGCTMLGVFVFKKAIGGIQRGTKR
ncbi:ABC transporter permease [Enterococcus xiangfangensis]|uniref:ABC transporter permease n=1 Tax=Enterococcus xiangfangensis TaxID=1296537 RepID=UPI0010F62ECC|nr:ABC transporter permease subunit [Enterococcus xiangfangensis]MBM7711579.1 putative spermidine/putrescine transport system permease protein [Enterococcus xiangfangensis]